MASHRAYSMPDIKVTKGRIKDSAAGSPRRQDSCMIEPTGPPNTPKRMRSNLGAVRKIFTFS